MLSINWKKNILITCFLASGFPLQSAAKATSRRKTCTGVVMAFLCAYVATHIPLSVAVLPPCLLTPQMLTESWRFTISFASAGDRDAFENAVNPWRKLTLTRIEGKSPRKTDYLISDVYITRDDSHCLVTRLSGITGFFNHIATRESIAINIIQTEQIS